MKKYFYLILIILTNCATTEVLTQKEKAVIINNNSYSLVNCKLKGVIKEKVPLYFGYDSYYIDHSANVFRRAAVKLEANMVVVIKNGTIGDIILGNAYKCN